MTNNQTNLFGERSVHIENNPLLTTVCNRVLQAVDRDKSLLDGDSVGRIVRRVSIALWKEDGLEAAVHSGDMQKVEEWFLSKSFTDSEVIGRACRYLCEKDLIRYSQAAVVKAERDRERISQSVKR